MEMHIMVKVNNTKNPDLDNVSVYICTYNEEDNIKACIESIQKNLVNDIYVVDSSENNETAIIAQESGAVVIKSPKGLAGQRQVAIEHCTTPYLMFVDADDRLDSVCITTLLKDMKADNFDAVQALLRVKNPETYWQHGMDCNLRYCISRPGKTNMVGRPAIYKSSVIKKAGADVDFNNIGNEDAAMSIRMEMMGAKQGIGNGISNRYHPATFVENRRAWQKYGYGDAMLLNKYPEKRLNVTKHLLFTYPMKRSMSLIINGKGKYIGYTIGSGVFRFLYMVKRLIVKGR